MSTILLLVVRAVAGGALVVAFAMVSDILKPKMFAGLFSAAPSVAAASLLVSGLAMGPAKVHQSAAGMIAGACGLVVYSVAAAFLVERVGAAAGSVLAWVAWLVPAGALFWFFLR
ncbi:MAG TPA: DUF3147 family protein [Candidatus Baltobacterales bacterium]|nr:DUF3147 family protein [Candidatus Baltobacterales bacterium]